MNVHMYCLYFKKDEIKPLRYYTYVQGFLLTYMVPEVHAEVYSSHSHMIHILMLELRIAGDRDIPL